MARPRFELSDAHGAELVRQVESLRARYPYDGVSHRPFCRAFIAAVHAITGAIHGPDTYRRLLAAYAPERGPSTTTLVKERDDFARSLAAAAPAAGAALSDGPGVDARAPDARAAADGVRAALADFLPSLRQLVAQPGRAAEFDFLAARLAHTERAHAELQAHAAQLAVRLAEQSARADALALQLAAGEAALARAQDLANTLAKEASGQRLFALQSIESSRAEARVLGERTRERAESLERQLRLAESTIDQLRLARGGAGMR